MVKGELGIEYVEGKYDSETITNNRSLVCLVAPFKDDSFVKKAYGNIKTAVADQKTTEEGALGYKYLEMLANSTNVKEIFIVNITTNTGTESDPVYDFELTDEKLANVFEVLADAKYNILALPYELTITQQAEYKKFWTEKLAKMEGNGAFLPLTPNTEGTNIQPFSETFKKGGIYGIVTTPVPLFNGMTLDLPEASVYFAGLISGIVENDKVSMRTLDNVGSPVTKEAYNKEVYEACLMNGALATKYKDSVRGIVAIANANTPTNNDLRIERVYHLIMNELREKLENAVGQSNNERITYPQFQTMCISIRDKYMKEDYITGLDWNVSKSGSASVDIKVKVNEDNIIQTINVYGELQINE